MSVNKSCLVGDVKLSPHANEKDCIDFLNELEQLMIKYDIDKIDIGWNRNALLTPTKEIFNVKFNELQ